MSPLVDRAWLDEVARHVAAAQAQVQLVVAKSERGSLDLEAAVAGCREAGKSLEGAELALREIGADPAAPAEVGS